MCGIVGICSSETVTERQWLQSASQTLIHRGPDGAGAWWSNNGRVGFAHRRLAIIDLTESGSQPMDYANGRYNCVFNGEIYNYKELRKELKSLGAQFQSDSDTEVLLAAYSVWGENCLEKFEGMFAFALYDQLTSTVLLARDISGQKPLFYRLDNGALRFASELKALFSEPGFQRKLCHESLSYFLEFGYVPGNRCLISGCKKLEPAHGLLFDLNTGGYKTWRYWSKPQFDSVSGMDARDESALSSELEELLKASVNMQMTADVPVGVLLSGGVDSSIIASLASQKVEKLRTFTVSFPGYGVIDESPHARLVSNYLRTNHTELAAEPASADLLLKLAAQFDEPIADSSMIPMYLVSKAVRNECKVALGGDGGDELFGGYGHYRRLLRLQKITEWMPGAMRVLIADLAQSKMPCGTKARNWLMSLRYDSSSLVPLIASHFDYKIRCELLKGYVPDPRSEHWAYFDTANTEGDILQRAMHADFDNYMVEDILVKVDRASMLNSLEVRSPFLDKRVIDFAFSSVPSHLKVNLSERKILLKRLSNKLLPAEFDRMRKRGFSIPIEAWLKRGVFRDFFRDVLLGDDCLFSKRVVKSLFEGQERGRNNGERLFSLVLLELWRREYGVSL